MKWYIKERHTMQVNYCAALGKLTKKEANRHRKPLVGINILHEYETEKEYIDECLRLSVKKQIN